MTHRISFLPYSEWDSDRGCVAFIALVDGRRARCLIDQETLLALTQQDASPPIRSFADHREAVEHLAKTLIQAGRLDGQELVIRPADVPHNRSADVAPVTPPEVRPGPASDRHLDGRQMTMPAFDRASVWSSLCQRQRAACESISKHAPRESAVRAFQELDQFESRTIPESAHELNLRRMEAGRMSESWRADSTQSATDSSSLEH